MEFNLLMTTAPRGMATVGETLHSLEFAGFRGSVDIFAEPNSEFAFPSLLGMKLNFHGNETKLGVVGNSYWALRYAMKELPDQPTILLQDDVVLCKSARKKLAESFSNGNPVSIGFAHEWNLKPQFNLFEPEWEGWQIWVPNKLLQDTFALNLQGSLCVGFRDRAVIDKIVQAKHMAQHVIGATTGDIPNRHWDNILFRTCAFENIPVWMHVPSLADHIGVESTIYPGRAINKRKGFKFNVEY